MNTKHKAAAAILIMSAFSCTDLHKDPIGLLTPEQISTEPMSFAIAIRRGQMERLGLNTCNVLSSCCATSQAAAKSLAPRRPRRGEELRLYASMPSALFIAADAVAQA